MLKTKSQGISITVEVIYHQFTEYVVGSGRCFGWRCEREWMTGMEVIHILLIEDMWSGYATFADSYNSQTTCVRSYAFP